MRTPATATAGQPRPHALVLGHRRLLDDAPGLRAGRRSWGCRRSPSPSTSTSPSGTRTTAATDEGLVERHASRHADDRRRGLLRRARRGAATGSPSCASCPASRPASRTCSPASVAAHLRDAPVDRVLGSLHSLAKDGRLVRRRPPAVAGRRRHDAPLPRRAGGHDREQRRLPGARARRLPAPLLAGRHAPLRGEGLRGGVPGGLPRAGHHRPGARGQHQQPAGLGRPGALVPRGGRRGGQLRQRRPPAPRRSGSTSTSPSTSWRRPASGPGRDRFDFWRR